MAVKQNWTAVGTTGNYQYQTKVGPNQTMICGRTGISSKYCDLSDEEIAKMIAAGSKTFRKTPAATVTAGKPGA